MRRWSVWGWADSWCWMNADALSRRGKLKGQLLFLRAALWVGLGAAAVAITAGIWFDYRFDQIRATAQEKTASVLATGLASALQDELVARDYAGLEARLQQSMANREVLSILVADTQGRVLSQVRRTKGGERPSPVFDLNSIALPTPGQMSEQRGIARMQWVPVEAGIPLGWLRLEIGNTEANDALHELQNQTTSVAMLASALLSLLLILVLQRTYSLMKAREAELQQAHDALESFAHYDALTQLPNRRLLMDHLRQAVANSDRHGHPLAVCFLDLDGFKQVNDQYGHDAGDELLCQVARRLECCVRASETVSRLGGDEFVILLTSFGDRAKCEDIVQRLLTDVGRPVQIGAHSVQVEASIGVALYPSAGSSADSLLEHADQAMYRAKRAGKNCWRFHGP